MAAVSISMCHLILAAITKNVTHVALSLFLEFIVVVSFLPYCSRLKCTIVCMFHGIIFFLISLKMHYVTPLH